MHMRAQLRGDGRRLGWASAIRGRAAHAATSQRAARHDSTGWHGFGEGDAGGMVMNSVAVVVPCYRYGQFLEDSVGSVLSQRGVDVRVLIIDDASPDDS